MKAPFVRIDWIDAKSSCTWLSKDELPSPAKITSFGFLVFEDEDCVVLIASLDRDMTTFSEAINIPRGCIKAVTTIEHSAFDDLNVET